jgi:hypothetical protein
MKTFSALNARRSNWCLPTRLVSFARLNQKLLWIMAAGFWVAAAAVQAQTPEFSLTVPTGTPAFGTSVAISGSFMVVGAPNDNTGAQGAGRAYLYNLDGTLTGPKVIFNNPNPFENAHFGYSVAISGTYVIIGKPGGIGSVYVYDLAGTLVRELINPHTFSGQFGYSVAISGNRVVVGSPFDDVVANDAGFVFVYDMSSGTPTTPIAELNEPSGFSNHNFGFSVSIDGTRVAVGSPRTPQGSGNSVLNAGSAYLFDLSSGTPNNPIATFKKPTPASDDFFGTSVAISGTRVVVGVPKDDTAVVNNITVQITDAGSAYVFDASSGTPTVPVATLRNPEPEPSDFFGDRVGISGTRVFVGSYADDHGATDAGSAYVYDLSSGTPTVPVVNLYNPAPAAGDQFAASVAISGTDVAVGASLDDTRGSDVGSAYLFNLASGTPDAPVKILVPGGGDNFGSSAAISGTLLVVGAPNDDTGATDAGSAYVYDLSSGTPTVALAILHNPSPSTGDSFGTAVAISGTRIAVGVPNKEIPTFDGGTVYVYDLSSGTPTVPVATLNNPAPAGFDRFGNSVGISGTRVVVGAAMDDAGATDSGSAYVYDLSSGTPTVPVATLNNPAPAPNDQFGGSVAISGTRVVVGAAMDDS